MARIANRFLNYPGDCLKSINEKIEAGESMGPTEYNEPLWPVSVEYDPEADRTRVGLSYIHP